MSVINTNVKSLVAQQALNKTDRELGTAMERLSTGKRINSARDDAAGLAISSRMDAQVRGLSMAVRNANDGISLMQTAEGALQEITNMLQRIRELSIQAVNGVQNDSDRAALDAEVQQLKAEIDRVALTTTFNNVVLFDGKYGERVLQIGHQAHQTMAFNMADMRSTALGADIAAALTAHGAKAADEAALLTAGALNAGDLVINGVPIGATNSADDDLSVDAKEASAIAKVAAINRVSEQTGVRATVGATVLEGSVMTVPGTAQTGTLTINGVTTESVTTSSDAGTTRDLIVDAINAIQNQTGVRAVNSGSDSGGVQLIADDGRNITLAFGGTLTDEATGLGTAGVQSGTYHLTSLNGDPISIGSQQLAPSVLQKSGLTAGTFANAEASITTRPREAAPATATASTVGAAGRLELGDLSINGTTIPAAVSADDTASNTFANSSSKAASAIAIAAAINKASETTGVTATANANVLVGTGFDNTTAGTLNINGVDITASTTTDTRQSVADKINAFTGQTGVVAEDNGTGLTLTAEDGRNISLGGTALASYGLTGITAGTGVDDDELVTHYATVTLTSASAFTIDQATKGNPSLQALGFFAGTHGGDSTGTRLSSVSIATAEQASQAIATLDRAIDRVSDVRSDFGAKQNRLEFTIDNLGNIVTNTSAAQSRIVDTDYAAETTNLARTQIIQQAATAMLAQANQQPSTVLSLLQ